MNSTTGSTKLSMLFSVGAICLTFVLGMSAQVKTHTSTEVGTATSTTQVESGEVVYVSGNDLVVRMSDGSIRHFTNVPDSKRIMVNGQQLTVHDLKPGMKLQRTITTTTTPKTIRTVTSVTGKVWNIMPPSSVILTLEDGRNQSFKIPKGQKFDVDGQQVDAWGLKKGMIVKATKVVEVPQTVIDQERQVSGTMPPPPAAPPADVPILVAVAEPVAAPAEVPAALPKTGSPLPLIGFLGFLSFASSCGLRLLRSKLG